MEGATRRELKDVASGNITIEEILNRAKFDDSFQISKFAILIEEPAAKPLCYHFTWESGVCLYGDKCRYVHNVDMILRALGDVVVSQKGPVVNMKRRPLEWILQGWIDDRVNIHKTVYIEFQGKIVWYRDGGKKSADLWEKCLENIKSRKNQLRAIASSVGGLDSISQTSIPESVQLLEQLLEDNFETVFSFLDIQDIVELFIAFVSNTYVRDELRTCLLSPYVWEAVVSSKWDLRFEHLQKPITAFLALKAATMEAHSQLVSSSVGLFTHGNLAGHDPYPASGCPALMELNPSSTPGKTILVSEEGYPVSDIRFTKSLIAMGNGNEVSLFRSGDLVKVGTCKQKSACSLVALPVSRQENIIAHAGSQGIYFRDLDEPSLKLKGKILYADDRDCVSLEAISHSVFLGARNGGLWRYSSQSTELISFYECRDITASRMISPDGRLHAVASASGIHLYDMRVKTAALQASLTSPAISLGTNGWASNQLAIGTLGGCELIDIRSAGQAPVWSAKSLPVHQVALTDRTLAIFQTTANQTTSTITTYAYDVSKPVFIGAHVVPFKVSAVGFSSDGAQTSVGCAYAIKRPKRSGRGDNGILCLGGPSFVSRSRSIRGASSFTNSRRASRDVI
jgi:hypothetical protein